MNFTQILKRSIILILFSVFVALSIVALKNLLEGKIGYSVRFETREKIPLPSWTLCPFSRTLQAPMYNVSNVQEFVNSLRKLPINFTVAIESSLNMTDANVLKQHFNATMEDTWNIHCKVNHFGTGCDPCLTFNAPRMWVGKFTAFLEIKKENIRQDSITLQFHDPDASLALNEEYNWNQVLYFKFRKGKTETFKRLSLTERKQISTQSNKCISHKWMKLDQAMYKIITNMIGCNLPWVRFKKESQETCQTETDYQAYFKANKALQKKIADLPPECRRNDWTVTNFFDEREWDYPNTEYRFQFLGQDLRVTIEEEDYQYGFSDFIGDFGGYLGLFLGGSFIGLFEIIEEFFEKCRQRKIINRSG